MSEEKKLNGTVIVTYRCNNGLSEASKEQLKHKTGEEIVDADIAQQMETK